MNSTATADLAPDMNIMSNSVLSLNGTSSDYSFTGNSSIWDGILSGILIGLKSPALRRYFFNVLNNFLYVIVIHVLSDSYMKNFVTSNACFRLGTIKGLQESVSYFITVYEFIFFPAFSYFILYFVEGMTTEIRFIIFEMSAFAAFILILLSTFHLEVYNLAILRWHAEAEPSRQSTFVTTPGFFLAALDQCLYTGLLYCVFTSSINYLLITLFLFTITAAVYDTVSISRFPVNNIDFNYRGLLICFIAAFGMYLYGYNSYSESVTVIYYVLFATLWLLIATARLETYTRAALNDRDAVNPLKTIYNSITDN